jgi:hypothetical protein
MAPKPVARLIEIFDERPYLPGNPSKIAEHKSVPSEWTLREIFERLSIAPHLTVYLSDEDGRRVIRP